MPVQELRMRGTDHYGAAAAPTRVPDASVGCRIGNRQENFLGFVADAIFNVQTAASEVRRDGARVDGKSSFGVQRFPRTVLFVLGDAETVFGRRTLCALVEFVGSHTERVHDDQSQ